MIYLNRSIEPCYKQTDNEHMVVSKQNPHPCLM